METLDNLEELARVALQHWGHQNVNLELVKHRENAVYSVTVNNDHRYALRIHRLNYHTDSELRSELQWMRALNDYGVRTPPVVPAKDNDLFKVVSTDQMPEGRQCDVLKWVSGNALGSVEEGVEGRLDTQTAIFRTVGQLMAKLHTHAESWTLPPGFSRHSWDIDGIVGSEPFWGRFWELETLTASQIELLQKARRLVGQKLEKFGQTRDRYGLIHADFLPENVLVDGHDINLIDFDDAGFGWHLFDIATTMFFLLGEEIFDDVLNALVVGYRRERDLRDEHLEQLPLFLMARGLTYVGWLHTRRETETAMEMTPLVVEAVTALAEDFLTTS